jgi:hypothetical protein
MNEQPGTCVTPTGKFVEDSTHAEKKRSPAEEERRRAEEKLHLEREVRWHVARRHVARVELAQQDACKAAMRQQTNRE